MGKNNKKTVLITGASRGIGRAAAELFAQNGYDLALNCVKSVGLLEELAEDLRLRYDTKVLTLAGDVSKYEFVKFMVEQTISVFDHIDVLVNNAGLAFFSLLTDMTPDDWHRVVDVNLSSAFYTSSLTVPFMVREKRGRIINIASIWGETGASCEVAYSAAKGGLIAFTRALAKELAPSNISVNAVSPGVIDTDMNRCFNEEEMQTLSENIPVGRLGGSEEVARVIYELAEAPSYLTAQIIRVDGGML